MTISCHSRLYKLEQGLISICCLISSYLYMQVVCFGWESYNQAFFFEYIFLMDLILCFFVEYTPNDGRNTAVKNHYQIAVHFINTDFLSHFIPIFPLQLLIDKTSHVERLIILIKVMRLVERSDSLFNVH